MPRPQNHQKPRSRGRGKREREGGSRWPHWECIDDPAHVRTVEEGLLPSSPSSRFSLSSPSLVRVSNRKRLRPSPLNMFWSGSCLFWLLGEMIYVLLTSQVLHHCQLRAWRSRSRHTRFRSRVFAVPQLQIRLLPWFCVQGRRRGQERGHLRACPSRGCKQAAGRRRQYTDAGSAPDECVQCLVKSIQYPSVPNIHTGLVVARGMRWSLR